MNGSMDKIINYSSKRGPVQPIPKKSFSIQISGNIEMKFNSSVRFLIRNFRVHSHKRREPSRETKLIFKRHAQHHGGPQFLQPPTLLGALASGTSARKKKYLTKQQERPTVKSSPSVAASLCCFFRQGNKK
jgi:hypothetical protein